MKTNRSTGNFICSFSNVALSTGSALSSRFDFFCEIARAPPAHARSSQRSPRRGPTSSVVRAVPRGWHRVSRPLTRSRSSNGLLLRLLLGRRRGAEGQCHPARASGAAVCVQRFRERRTSWRFRVWLRFLVPQRQQFVF